MKKTKKKKKRKKKKIGGGGSAADMLAGVFSIIWITTIQEEAKDKQPGIRKEGEIERNQCLHAAWA